MSEDQSDNEHDENLPPEEEEGQTPPSTEDEVTVTDIDNEMRDIDEEAILEEYATVESTRSSTQAQQELEKTDEDREIEAMVQDEYADQETLIEENPLVDEQAGETKTTEQENENEEGDVVFEDSLIEVQALDGTKAATKEESGEDVIFEDSLIEVQALDGSKAAPKKESEEGVVFEDSLIEVTALDPDEDEGTAKPDDEGEVIELHGSQEQESEEPEPATEVNDSTINEPSVEFENAKENEEDNIQPTDDVEEVAETEVATENETEHEETEASENEDDSVEKAHDKLETEENDPSDHVEVNKDEQHEVEEVAAEAAEESLEDPVAASEDNSEEVAEVTELKPKKKKSDAGISILFKQVGLTVLLIVATVALVTYVSVNSFSETSLGRARDANTSEASLRSLALENQISNSLNNIRLLGALLVRDQRTSAKQEKLRNLVFTKDGEVVSFEIYKKTGGTFRSTTKLTNQEYLESVMLGPDYIDLVNAEINFPIAAVFSSTNESPVLEVKNASVENGIPLLAIGMPLVITETGITTHVVVSYLRLDTLQKLITSDIGMVFAVDASGTVIAHPDDKLTLGRKSLKDSPIVQYAFRKPQRVGSTTFKIDAEEFVGAYGKTKYGITVIAQAQKALILEDAEQVRHESFGLAAMAISIALFFIYLFATTLTNPIEILEAFAKRISKGEFDDRPIIKSRDEVGRLSRTMNEMVDGLVERDKAKNLINKFHGTVGEELMKGEIERGGSRKEVTVFFSDIRGFTAFSESHTAEEVVEMLNDYFSVMVAIVNQNNGIIDKFIGDAIMAIWGAFSDDPAQARRDAVQACLEMREALVDYNQRRLDAGKEIIKIGIGLHSGEAIAGTIGSDEKLEYTVIGDTVNLAARIEASTKAFGTDLLVSDALYDNVQDMFWLIEAGKAEVKGKSKPITMYKVRGRIVDGEQVEVRTEFSDYDAEGADKVKLVS